MLLKLAVILSIPLFTAALPKGGRPPKNQSCPVAKAVLTFPPGQTALAIPSGQVPNHILLGTGVQNYTCTDAGTYTSAGAVAELRDISCMYGTPEFDTIQDDECFDGRIQQAPVIVNHYFITNSAGGISPKFASASDGGASFIVASKAASIHDADPTNIDWLQLANVSGDYAKTIFRVDTNGGQPPASCTPGSALISVKYAAKYWFFG